MCFTSQASFIAATTLLATGIVAVKKTNDKSQLLFAAIPIIFAIQQFTEGFLWIALRNDSHTELKNILTYFFLIFAQVVWPIWVPLAFYLITKNVTRKKIIGWLAIAGCIVSLLSLYCIITCPVEAKITSNHIFYEVHYPNIHKIGYVFYFAAIIFPAFVSDMRLTWIMGVLNLSSFIISKLFFKDEVISVWCFFAAAISIMIVVILHKASKKIRSRGPLVLHT